MRSGSALLSWLVLAAGPALGWLAPAGTLAAPLRQMEGTVTRVSDGDTLWLRPAAGGKPLKVRVQGIDAPEICQPWGVQAQQALAQRTLNMQVSLVEGPLDDHGRRLGRLMQGDQDIGAQMVRDGHAWSYRFRRDPGPDPAEERAARAGRRGLFGQPEPPEPPRDFRRRHGPCPISASPSAAR